MSKFYLKNYGSFTKGEYRILQSLENGEEKRFSELVESTGLSKPVVSKSASELIEENLIKKYPSKKDQRVRIYSMTEKGIKEYQKARKRVIKDLKEVKRRVEKNIQKA
ncbi:MAG: Transcriptional regulator, MarR family [Candidatus Methanohalarchaeum thermophilum]|uniref:Transcriptional regulator, MarR family n=1 Tax=Methanohalarchaeum thermophilum TaxID=1903181 RepID=A0A1Q6DT61_METT1|nr:MAG: Transcriptional regulator, MarR family [Candidatus Methanohalarchaeum thermophilum]